MFAMRYAELEDMDFWLSLDGHISREVFAKKAALHECCIMEYAGERAGILRYNFFWDEIPFLNFIFVLKTHREKGIGKKAVLCWEDAMQRLGYRLVMTSTMVEEQAQHFYRKIGYKECGCLLKDMAPLEESMEMFMMKQI